MCFVNRFGTAQIEAKTDIVVYKYMKTGQEGRIFSPFFDTDFPKGYRFNKTYNARKSNLESVTTVKKLDTDQENHIFYGFHSCISKWEAYTYIVEFNEVVVKCVIPKGAFYLKNPSMGEYVSTKLIFKEILK